MLPTVLIAKFTRIVYGATQNSSRLDQEFCTGSTSTIVQLYAIIHLRVRLEKAYTPAHVLCFSRSVAYRINHGTGDPL